MYRHFLSRAAAGATALMALLLAGCPPPTPKEAISVSNDFLPIDRNTVPVTVEVWNNNPTAGSLTLTVAPSAEWIATNVSSVVSNAPTSPGGPFDKKSVIITINRSRLRAGTHEGSVRFTADGVVTAKINIRVIQDEDGTFGDINVVNPRVSFTAPYLIDFTFALKDGDGRSVVDAPGNFEVTATEGDEAINPFLTGIHLKRAAALPLRLMLVLDYSLNMSLRPNAIVTMESAAIDLLEALNVDARVGVVEFHREDDLTPPAVVADFTVDHDFIAEEINGIQEEYVQGRHGASRAFDALMLAAQRFPVINSTNEARYIVFFSGGPDNSSGADINDVVDAAEARGIGIYAIGFSGDEDLTNLLNLTSRTDGAYFPAESVAQLPDAIADIVDDLDGQYHLRWASLRRDGTPFRPAFTITHEGDETTYRSNQTFVDSNYAGNTLEGRLRFEASESPERTTLFLRAEYVPRFVNALRLYVRAEETFAVGLVDAASEGLLAGWDMNIENLSPGEMWIELESPDGETIPFGTFGPMLRFAFDAVLDPLVPAFEAVAVDNSIYGPSGPSFDVDRYDDEPPAPSQTGTSSEGTL